MVFHVTAMFTQFMKGGPLVTHDRRTDPTTLSAQALAHAIRDGQLSAVEVLEAYLDRVAQCNPSINAIVTLDAAGARKRAQAADAALARGQIWGPLHGVPFTVKDVFETEGLRTTAGFPPLTDY